MLQNADVALYAVKAVGGNNYQFFSHTTHHIFKKQSFLERALPDAIKKNQLFLLYQPIHKLPNKEIVSMEVLLRWKHPEYGVVHPDDFITIAERNGFIVSIDEWVIKSTCKQYVEWLSQGRISTSIKIAINLSPIYISKTTFIEVLLDILKDTGMPAKNLELEVTESALMTNLINLDPIFEQLQSLGIKLSIDNFGIGYSSLKRLKNLPVNTLKIDKSFINNLEKEQDTTIVKSIIALGDSMGLDVITEGVESREQLDLLLRYKCPMAQGYYFEKPLNSKQMSNLMKKPSVTEK